MVFGKHENGVKGRHECRPKHPIGFFQKKH